MGYEAGSILQGLMSSDFYPAPDHASNGLNFLSGHGTRHWVKIVVIFIRTGLDHCKKFLKFLSGMDQASISILGGPVEGLRRRYQFVNPKPRCVVACRSIMINRGKICQARNRHIILRLNAYCQAKLGIKYQLSARIECQCKCTKMSRIVLFKTKGNQTTSSVVLTDSSLKNARSRVFFLCHESTGSANSFQEGGEPEGEFDTTVIRLLSAAIIEFKYIFPRTRIPT